MLNLYCHVCIDSILIFTGFPHIHGVAWIADWCLKQYGFKDGLLSNGSEEAIVNLADELISVSVPEPVPIKNPNDKDECHQNTRDKMLKKAVQQVQWHRHTKSCLKYNGVCRYNFPRFPCKKTLLAQPLKLEYTSEEEKKRKEKEI